MPEISETIYAPELEGGEWIQHGQVNIRELRGKAAVLVDFWDYTCVNCIRTLSYIAGWYRRYASHGLVIVGVHAPEFAFARERQHVVETARAFGLHYPIVLDNEYAIWRAYSNRFWPAKYVIDGQGRIRYYHFGEAAYQETENHLQKLLRELNPSLSLPPPMEPVRESDRPDAVCYRVTPEIYLGYSRGQFGNPEGIVHDTAHDYRDPGRRAEGVAYLGGRWRVGSGERPSRGSRRRDRAALHGQGREPGARAIAAGRTGGTDAGRVPAAWRGREDRAWPHDSHGRLAADV